MKNILLILTVVLAASTTVLGQNKITTIEATYIGQSDKAYYFSNKESGNMIEFTFISKKASSKYDLNSKEHISKHFTVAYEIDPIEIGSKDADAESTIKQYKQRLILIDIDISEKEGVIKEE